MTRFFRFFTLCLCLLLCSSEATAEGGSVFFQGRAYDSSAESIDLGDTVVEDWEAFSAFLRQFPELKQADMFATTVEKADIDRLTEAFPNIRFGWTIHIARSHYIRTDATAFSTLHGACVTHDSAVFEVLKYCTGLRALDLGHNKIESIDFLKDLTELRVLILACNPKLKDIRPLENLEKLEYLELFSCNVSDISCLAELPNLMDLNLCCNTGLIDHTPLLGMKKLQRLWIADTGIARNNGRIQEIHSALPDTRIQTRGEPTANGWRKDAPHYEVIYEIFHTGVYRPFDDSRPDADP